MNKTKVFYSIFATTLVVLASVPVLVVSNNTPKVQAASGCVDYSDDFSISKNKWVPAIGYMYYNNGKLNLETDSINSVSALLDLSASEDIAYEIPGDWTLEFEIPSMFVDAINDTNYALGGGDLYTGENNTITEAYTFYIAHYNDADKVHVKVTGYKNGVSETYANVDITSEFWANKGQSKLIYVKTGNTLELFFSGSNGKQLIHTFNDIMENPRFRITGNFSEEGFYSIDNFKLTCGTNVPEPTPEPTDSLVEYEPGAIYRFYNLRTRNTHFYTQSVDEAKFVFDNSQPGGIWPGVFEQEKPTFSGEIYTDVCPGTSQPVYRFFNKRTQDTHFYAFGQEEYDVVINNFSDRFSDEGIAFCAYDTQVDGTVPVYRWLNKIEGDTHFYTAEQSEKEFVDTSLTDIFEFEKVSFYALLGSY